MTPAQCIAARRLLGWSARELGRRAGITGSTVNRFEDGNPVHNATTSVIRQALTEAGVRIEQPGSPRPNAPVVAVELADGSRISIVRAK